MENKKKKLKFKSLKIPPINKMFEKFEVKLRNIND